MAALLLAYAIFLPASSFASPELVKDIAGTGSNNSTPLGFTRIGDSVFFAAGDGVVGRELWVSDGSTDGTRLVKDIHAGPEGSLPTELVAIGDTLFFTADDGTHGRELWRSDGSAAGTQMVEEIYPGPDSYKVTPGFPGNFISPLHLSELVPVGSDLFFKASNAVDGFELWKSDGTEEGTVLIKDINPGSSDGFVTGAGSALTNAHGTLFFTATDGIHGLELWKSDGTESGTVLVKDIVPGSDNSYPSGSWELSENKPFAVASDQIFLVPDEIWKSDGTEAGTQLVKALQPENSGSSLPKELTVLDDTLFFTAIDQVHGRELWRSDGNEVGTEIVKDISPGGSFPSARDTLTVIGSDLYFAADDGTHGLELWRSDGTESGTVMADDIAPGSADSSPTSFKAVRDQLYFAADDGTHGVEAWRADDEAGAEELGDVAPGDGSSSPSGFVEIGGRLLFSANDGTHGRELWALDLEPLPPLGEVGQGTFFWLAGEETGTLSLDGWANPSGSSATCFFEYGLGAEDAKSVPCDENPGSGSQPVFVTAEVEELPVEPSSFDKFRLVVTSAGGQSVSEWATIGFMHGDGGCGFTSKCDGETENGLPVTGPPAEGSRHPDHQGIEPSAVSSGVLADGEAHVRRGKVLLRIRCEALDVARCAGRLELWRRVHRVGSGSRRLMLGSGSYDIEAGRTVITGIGLTRDGRRLLADSDGSLKVALHGDAKDRVVMLTVATAAP